MQIDGSEHRWFEDRAEPCTLLVFVDDATSKLMQLRFVHSESTESYFAALRGYQSSPPVRQRLPDRRDRRGMPSRRFSERGKAELCCIWTVAAALGPDFCSMIKGEFGNGLLAQQPHFLVLLLRLA